MTKYNAKKITIDNITFASKMEARRYEELKLLERGGVISRLELQPSFILLEGFKDRDGKKQRPIKYVADFQYVEDGEIIVEDVKGYAKNRVWLLKKKLFLARYPEYKLKVTK